jgi:hypothetical protein
MKPEMYSEDKIDQIYSYLEKQADKDKPYDFKVIVDDNEVIHRTNDIDDFRLYEQFVNDDSKTLEVIVYTSQKNCTRRLFYFDPADLDKALTEQEKPKALNGIDIEDRIQAAVQNERKKWDEELERRTLVEENKMLKDDLEERDNEIVELESENESLKNELDELKRSTPGIELLGKVGSSLMKSTVQDNIEGVRKIPIFGETLAGIFSPDENQQQTLPEQDTAVRVQRVPETINGEYDQENVMSYLLNQFKVAFNKDQYDQVMVILEKLRVSPSNIKTVFDLLHEENDNTQSNEIHI